MIYPILISLCTDLKINIITFEYRKISESFALAKEQEMTKDAILITTYVSLLDHITQIDLMGVSVGSYLILSALPEQMKFKNKKFKDKLKHIIAIAPTWVFTPEFLRKSQTNKLTKSFAKKNTNKIIESLKVLQVPTLIVHGKQDYIVKYLLSISICAKLPNVLEWYPKNGDHHNLFDNIFRKKLFGKIRQCLLFNNSSFNKKNANQTLQKNDIGFGSNLLSETENIQLNLTDNNEYGNSEWNEMKETVNFGMGQNMNQNNMEEGTFKPKEGTLMKNSNVGGGKEEGIGSKVSEGFTFNDPNKNYVCSFKIGTVTNNNIIGSLKPQNQNPSNNIVCSFQNYDNKNNINNNLISNELLIDNNSKEEDKVGSFNNEGITKVDIN